MQGKALQQLAEAAGFQGDAQLSAAEKGPQQVFLKITRQRGHGADAQLPVGLQRALQGHLQFAAEGEDTVGIIQHQLSCFGEQQIAPGTDEQRMTQLLFERANLRRECRLGDMQRLGCAGQIAFLGHSPEVVQVMEVEPSHA